MEWLGNVFSGLSFALLGAVFAYVLPATASGIGGRMVAEAANGVLAEDPKKFGQCLILQAVCNSSSFSVSSMNPVVGLSPHYLIKQNMWK